MADEEAGPSIQPSVPPPPMCEVCLQHPSKYKCPGCQIRTCSLACVKSHKEPKEGSGGTSGCNGKRDRLKYVSLTDFDDRQLLSDYSLLEEVKRADDVAQRCLPPFPRHQLPPPLQTLVYQANKRRVDLRLMAPGMSRRANNTTRFNGQEQKLSWRVEWHFYSSPSTLPPNLPGATACTTDATASKAEVPQDQGQEAVEVGKEVRLDLPSVAPMNEEELDLDDEEELDLDDEDKEEVQEGGEGQEVGLELGPKAASSEVETEAPPAPPLTSQLPPPIVLVDEKVAEDQTLLQTLQDHLSHFKPNSGAGARQFSLREFWRDASMLKVFMKKEEQPANSPCYYSMDLNRSLGSQLAGKVVIEYPVFCVCLPDLIGCFPAGSRVALGPLGGGGGRGRGEGMRGGRGRGGRGYRGRGGRFDGGRGRGGFRGGGRGPGRGRGRGEKRPREGS